MNIERSLVATLDTRLNEVRPLIQVILGSRQVGKSTSVDQFLAHYTGAYHFALAEEVSVPNNSWLFEQWQKTEALGAGALLVIDEIQKIENWSEIIKKLWDTAIRDKRRIKVLLLGSSSLSLQKGLSESLTGRFELIPAYHWSFEESRRAFKYDLDNFLALGGYPKLADFKKDAARARAYAADAIVETVIGKDILRYQSVRSPALFRQCFELICAHAGREISYTKLLGQLQQKGNTDLVKHYIDLYGGAFLVRALTKYSKNEIRKRTSSPKIIVCAPVLAAMAMGPDTGTPSEIRGFQFENAVGAELLKAPGKLYYWRDGNDEVDFVLETPQHLYAIEVKSGRKKFPPGLDAFTKRYPRAKPLIVTPDNFIKLPSLVKG